MSTPTTGSTTPKTPPPASRPQPRRMPTPAELFGRRSRPAPRPADPEEPELATGTG